MENKWKRLPILRGSALLLVWGINRLEWPWGRYLLLSVGCFTDIIRCVNFVGKICKLDTAFEMKTLVHRQCNK